MSECRQVRLLLAVAPREWSDGERARVEAHLATCAACAALAAGYAAQERMAAALPRPGLEPGRQQAVLALARGKGGGTAWRVRLSNALGMAAAALLVVFLALALSALLGRAPGQGAFSTPSAALTTPVPTPTRRPAAAVAESPAAPLILVDNGPRSGLGPAEPWPPPDLYTLLAEGNYQVRYRFPQAGLEAGPGAWLPQRPISPDELAGVDLYLVPWAGCYASASSVREGTTEYDFNLTAGEAATIRAFVADGGQALFILDPTYKCRFEALSVLGVQADVTQAVTWQDGAFHPATGRLGGRSFSLAAQYRFQPLRSSSGESWAEVDGQDALVVEPIGRGRVAVLGLPRLADGRRTVPEEADEGQPAPLFADDNLAFLLSVVEVLTGAPSGLDVERIAWEGRRGALLLAAERLVLRLDAWTEERIAWAAPNEEERQEVSAEVLALRTRLGEGVGLLDRLLETGPDPEGYEALRGTLRKVLAGANRLDAVYGPAASESWEARQARRLQPWLLGLLGGAAVLGVASWRVRRLDAEPAALARQVVALLPYVAAGLLLLAHLLAAADLVGFGLRAGGYPLNRWGVWAYAAIAVAGTLLFLFARSRALGSLARLALPLLAALALMQAHLLTDLAGAEYATYRDYEAGIALLGNLLVALAFCLAGVLYRRPRWLAAMGGVHLALAVGVMAGSSVLYALRDGFASWQVTRVLLPPSSLPYLAIVYGMGLLAARPVRPRVYWRVAALVVVGFVAAGSLLLIRDLAWTSSSAPAVVDWLSNLLLVPLLLFLGLLSAAYAWHARRAARGSPPLASPLAAVVLLLGLAALLTPLLLDASLLPASGAEMPWRGEEYQVPAGAWTLLLPIARVLADVAPWAVLAAVALPALQGFIASRTSR